MDRRAFIAAAVSLLAAPLAAEAQSAGKVYRIGELREGVLPPAEAKPFWDTIRQLGWVEGQNLRVERRSAERPDQLPALAAELAQLKLDLILTNGTPATRAAKEATKTIPIVFTLAGDPVERGLVASLARPGGNLTGWAWGLYEQKQLEVVKEALPRISRVAYPSSSIGCQRCTTTKSLLSVPVA